MSFSVFILYAVPALFMAFIGYAIPTWSVDDKFKYIIYALCVLLTFVFKFYVDGAFKSADLKKTRDEDLKKDRKIKSLEKQVDDLESEFRVRELEHAEAYQNIEGKLSSHLKVNSKCKENEELWAGVETVSVDIISLMKDSMNESKKSRSKTNRK